MRVTGDRRPSARQVGDTTLDPAILGMPSYRIALDPLRLAIFHAVLVVALAVAVLLAAGYTYRLSLERALRVGED